MMCSIKNVIIIVRKFQRLGLKVGATAFGGKLVSLLVCTDIFIILLYLDKPYAI